MFNRNRFNDSLLNPAKTSSSDPIHLYGNNNTSNINCSITVFKFRCFLMFATNPLASLTFDLLRDPIIRNNMLKKYKDKLGLKIKLH